MAAAVKRAVAGGDCASTSEVVREALRDWKAKDALQLQELTALKADIDKGLADVAAGRVEDFDADRIVERGRKLFSEPLPLCLTGSRPCRGLGLVGRHRPPLFSVTIPYACELAADYKLCIIASLMSHRRRGGTAHAYGFGG